MTRGIGARPRIRKDEGEMRQSTYGISLGVLNPDGGVGGETRGLCCGVDIVADCGPVPLV